ncbi:MAG TPA: LLM class flavin-dependent oxidoreductase [Solirubrobacteraceae bacterium]|nr:LLM class flavin-dependent oxidoreductase [Solirubrobacteraceae bacterium]
MRFGFSSEADTRPGTTHAHRYFELVEEVLLAEKVGFDMFGTSEQHFAIGEATVSCPEVLYPYLMPLTSRIKFAHKVALLPTRINHALRVAERAATGDILSNGRVELGVGRGNTTLALRAFEVSVDNNRGEFEEGIDLIRAAFLNDPFSFVGEHYKVPPRSLVPKPIQQPHPPMFAAATGPDSHRMAAEKGIGVVSFSSFLGFDYLGKSLALYDEAFDGTDHTLPVRRSKGALIFAMHCAETTAEAREEIKPLVEVAKLATGAYERLSKLSKDYAYMGAITDVADKLDDLDYMLNESASYMAGDPDELVKQLKRYEALGVEDVWMRIDSMPHEKLMRSIELFGKYVIPHFKTPSAVVRSSDAVLEDIRAMRPAHEEAVRRWTEEREQERELAGRPA